MRYLPTKISMGKNAVIEIDQENNKEGKVICHCDCFEQARIIAISLNKTESCE